MSSKIAMRIKVKLSILYLILQLCRQHYIFPGENIKDKISHGVAHLKQGDQFRAAFTERVRFTKRTRVVLPPTQQLHNGGNNHYVNKVIWPRGFKACVMLN